MSWTCPFCDHVQTVISKQMFDRVVPINLAQPVEGDVAIRIYALGCSNNECRHSTVQTRFINYETTSAGGALVYRETGTPLHVAHHSPTSLARVFPDYVPQPLREDYEEACAIRDLSPKAAATLIRRCLQGMIRDFCGISKSRLVDEIDELRKRVGAGSAPPGVSPESVQAIDNIRGIGNIGAHMERDIDVIVAVDPDEAQLLIELTETLFDEWYVERHKRQERFAAVAALAAQKKAELEAAKLSALAEQAQASPDSLP